MNKTTSKTSTQIESKEKARKGASKKYTDLEADISGGARFPPTKGLALPTEGLIFFKT